MKNHESISDKIDVSKLKKGSEKPNWICKDCYDGGIIVEQPIDKKIAEESFIIISMKKHLLYQQPASCIGMSMFKKSHRKGNSGE